MHSPSLPTSTSIPLLLLSLSLLTNAVPSPQQFTNSSIPRAPFDVGPAFPPVSFSATTLSPTATPSDSSSATTLSPTATPSDSSSATTLSPTATPSSDSSSTRGLSGIGTAFSPIPASTSPSPSPTTITNSTSTGPLVGFGTGASLPPPPPAPASDATNSTDASLDFAPNSALICPLPRTGPEPPPVFNPICVRRGARPCRRDRDCGPTSACQCLGLDASDGVDQKDLKRVKKVTGICGTRQPVPVEVPEGC